MNRRTGVSRVHHHRHRCHHKSSAPSSVHATGIGEEVRVCLRTGREPLRKVVTVVTAVIVPEVGTTCAAGATELKC
jgi:hypothetical protein